MLRTGPFSPVSAATGGHASPRTTGRPTDILELTNATLFRGGSRVIHGMTLRIGAGEHTAILGPNGAGKSSLIRMLMLEDRPVASDDGQAPLRLFGREHWDIAELRLRLGIVTGDFDGAFGLGTSGGRVCGLDVAVSGMLASQGIFAHHQVTDAMRDAARQALARVEATHLEHKLLNQMSTGERRRVLIARALVTRPEALLLDEPTTGLDVVARPRFMETVRRLAREGTTVILVTHHVDEVIPEIRRIVLLRDGAIHFDGPPEAALTPSTLGATFGAPVHVEQASGYYHVRMAR